MRVPSVGDRLEFISAQWSAPQRVRALTSTRVGGVSADGYDSLNLASHVDDHPERVEENRRRLGLALGLDSEPKWLRQVHAGAVVDAESVSRNTTADGSVTDQAGVICAILTADCLPVFLTDRSGSRVALLHAGWRGLAAGILAAGVAGMSCPASSLLAWLGPAIGPNAFEVGAQVRDCLVRRNPEQATAFQASGRAGHWFADLYALAKQELHGLGVGEISAADELCTWSDSERFFSYRRERTCGRMASLVWIEPESRD